MTSSITVYFKMSVVAGVLVVVLLVAVAYLFRRPNNVPPGPPGLPVIGNVLIMNASNLYLTLTQYSETYGGIMSLKIGPKLVVVLNSLDVAKEAYIDHAAAFSMRFIPPALEYIFGRKGSLIFDHGPIWRERRKFVVTAFRDFGVGKRNLELRVNDEAGYVIDAIDQANGKPLDLRHTINNAVSNIICSLCFGERFDYNDKRFEELLRKLHINASSITFGGIVHVFPFLTDTPIYGYMKKDFHALIDFIKGLTKEHHDSLNSNDVRDILDKYLLEIERQEESGEEIRFKKADDWRLVFELFLAGTESTTNTLLFIILFVTYYQDIQQKIFDEIMEVIGDARRPQLSDRPNLPYTEATILEILRHRPASAIAPPRMVSTDTTVAGYSIPKGTGVFLNVFAVNHDERLFDNPYKFDPTRFLSPDGKTLVKDDHIITFGAGRRACLGENLARMELFFFVTNIFQRFHLRFPDNGADIDLNGTQGISLKPLPFEICAERH